VKNTLSSYNIPIICSVTDVLEETADVKTFTFQTDNGEQIEYLPGQFFMLTAFGIGEAPFAFSSIAGKKFQATIRKAGSVTIAIHEFKKGTKIGIRGPFGKPFPIDELKKASAIIIVAGGIGLPPLRSLIQYLIANKFPKQIILYGARTPGDLLHTSEYDQWTKSKNVEMHVTVDNGDEQWKGNVGVVTTLFDKISVPEKAKVVTVGPAIMMKFVIKKCLELGIDSKDIFVSLENRMTCGYGKCGNCAYGKYLVCKDGPVFSHEEIKDIEGIF
jgi:NAD(P)H-flavin reductase